MASLLFTLMEVVKEAIVGYVSDAGLPAYTEAYVTPGKPAYECVNVAIVWGTVLGQADMNLPNAGSPQRVINRGVKSCTIEYALVECVQTQDDLGHFPSLAQYASDAELIYTRADVVYTGLLCDISHRTLWSGTVIAQPPAETSLSKFMWDPPSGAALVGHGTITTQLQV